MAEKGKEKKNFASNATFRAYSGFNLFKTKYFCKNELVLG